MAANCVIFKWFHNDLLETVSIITHVIASRSGPLQRLGWTHADHITNTLYNQLWPPLHKQSSRHILAHFLPITVQSVPLTSTSCCRPNPSRPVCCDIAHISFSVLDNLRLVTAGSIITSYFPSISVPNLMTTTVHPTTVTGQR
jgi:hypothetical protein